MSEVNSVSADRTIWKAADHIGVAVVIEQGQHDAYLGLVSYILDGRVKSLDRSVLRSLAERARAYDRTSAHGDVKE